MKRHPVTRLLSLLLAAVMVLGLLPAASAAETDLNGLRSSDRLIRQDGEAPSHKPADTVRVAIVLEEPSTVEAGFSTSSIATNPQALSHQAELNRSQQSMARTISAQALGGQRLDVVWNLTLIANLISANVPYGAIDAIRAVDGVREVVLERQYSPDTAQPQTYSSASMVGATTVWESGLTGAGSRVAIVDTGTDTDHQSFDNGAFLHALEQNAADKGMGPDAYLNSLDLLDTQQIQAVLPYLNATERIGAEAEDYYLNEKLPFAANYVDRNLTVDHDSDYQGSHGSHVAGIAAANRFIPQGGGYAEARQTVRMCGVAPDAQIITLKVFGNAAGPYDSDYFAAIEDAIWLGCDSVNLSLGTGSPGTSDNELFAELLEFLATTDTVVVMSAGNSGFWAEKTAGGYLYNDGVSFHTGGSPGSYTNSLCVASVDNDGSVGTYFTVGDRMVVYTETTGYRNLAMSTLDYSSDGTGISYDYLFIDGIGNAADYQGLDLTGKVVFCSRGETSFDEKANVAAGLGAEAVVIYNNTSGVIGMNLSDYRYSAPCVSITQKDAEAIRAASNNAGTHYTGKLTVYRSLGGAGYGSDYYTMSTFSSWGTPGSLEMKPEITAPGGQIWSVNGVDTSGTAYEMMSGTSMAAPQVTGMAALVAEYIRDKGLEEKTGMSVRHLAQSLLMSTAVPLFEENSGSYYSILNQGAGLARVDLAASAESYVLVDGMTDGKVKVELGEDPDRTGKYEFSFTIHDLSGETKTYDLRADLFTQDVFDGGNGTMYLGTWTRMLGCEADFYCDGLSLEEMESGFRRDLNGDGVTDAADADYLLEYLVGNVSELHADGDLDGDGRITSFDAHMLLTKRSGSCSVTVPAGTSVTVDVKLKLTAESRELLAEYYPTGAYIEGFVYAEAAADAEGAEGESHSIPVLGYYGSWTEPGMFDVGSYGEYMAGAESRTPYLYNLNGNQSNFVSIDYGDGDEYLFGGNPFVQEAAYLPRRNAFNNESGAMLRNLYFSLIRNAAQTKVVLKNTDTGEVLEQQELGLQEGAYYHTNTGAWYNTQDRLGLGLNLAGIPEGSHLELSLIAAPELYVTGGTVDYDALGAGAYLTTPITIDNTDPELMGYALEGNTLTVTARDNQYIAAVALLNAAGTNILTAVPGDQTTPDTTLTARVDLSNVYGSSFLLAVFDYAENMTAVPVNLELNNERPRFTLINVSDLNDLDEASYVGISDSGITSPLAVAEGRGPARAAEYVDGWVFEISSDNRLYVGSDDDLYEFRELGALDPENEWKIWSFNDLAYSTADGKLYGSFYSESNDMNVPYLCTIDLYTGTMTVLGELPVDVSTLAIDDAGNFYGTGYGTSRLYTFKAGAVTTKKYSLVGSLDGYATTSRNSMAWDHNTDELFWACTNSDNTYLLKVNPSDGAVSYLTSLPFSSVGLYIAWDTLGDTFAPVNQVKDVILPQTAQTLVGNSIQLQARILPWNVSDEGILWSSSDSAVAAVDENGVVTGIGEGTAVLTAASRLDPSKKDTCTVTVSALDRDLKALIWDEEGQVWWSEFNTDTLHGYKKLASAGDLPLATTAVADGVLYAATIETTSGLSDLYIVDPDTYAVTKVGGSQSLAYMDMAWSPNLGMLMATYFNYIALVDPQTGDYIGAFDWTEGVAGDLIGITYVGSEYNDYYGAWADNFLILDSYGDVYLEAFLSTGSTIGCLNGPEELQVHMGDPVDYSYFQGFWFDGDYAYWTRFNEEDNEVELKVWDVAGGSVYSMGTFPEAVWPVGGLYTDDAVSGTLSVDFADAELTVMELEQAIEPVALAEARGGLNGFQTLSSGKAEPDGTVQMLVTIPAEAPSGMLEVDYDDALLELVSVGSMPDISAWSGGNGTVKLAFAQEQSLPEDSQVALLTFKALGEGSTDAAVRTVELAGEYSDHREQIRLNLPHVCPSAQFVDVSESRWFHEAVDYVVEKGYMNGMNDTHFGPNVSITRAQFLTVLWRMAGSPEVELTDKFTDVEPKRFYTKAVSWAVANGITSGMTETTFCPDNELTRAQLVTFMYRYAQWQGKDTSYAENMSGFEDADDVSKFARVPFHWALSHGIITGVTNTTLVPDGKATRAQAATIFRRFDLNLAD